MYHKTCNGIAGDLSVADCSVIDSEFVSEYCQKNLQISKETRRYSSGSEDETNHLGTEDPADKHSLSALSLEDSNLKHSSEFGSTDNHIDPNYYTEPIQTNHYSEIPDLYPDTHYGHTPFTTQEEVQQNLFNQLLSNTKQASDEVHTCNESTKDPLNKDYMCSHSNNNSINIDLDGTQDPLLESCGDNQPNTDIGTHTNDRNNKFSW